MSSPAPAHAPDVSRHAKTSSPRVDTIDLLRGLIMVVMALDHTRDYFHHETLLGASPTTMATTTLPFFFTRFVTHFCAPIFSFLAGVSVFLASKRGRPASETSWLLVKRGVWLLFLELTVMLFFWEFAWSPGALVGQVLWALGWSMITLAALVHFKPTVALVFGLVVIAGHNALDPVKAETFGVLAPLWNVLHVQGEITMPGGVVFNAYYPLLPWVGVMAAGYGFAPLFDRASAERKRLFLKLGSGLLVGFLVLRYLNSYGDLRPWTVQTRPGFTALSFLNVTKYPPSLDYLLLTLGTGVLALGVLENGIPRFLKPVQVFGRVPFFYYLLHVPLIHGLEVIWSRWKYGGGDYYAFGTAKPPADVGFTLATTYGVWLLVVLTLYPACRWFAELKSRKKAPWMSYF